MENRNIIFQRLKPRCVALSQTALALNGPRGNVQAVASDLLGLKTILSDVTKSENALDEKLADYVFFPLSQVLKVSQKASVRCLELCLQCLSIVIQHGWRSHIQPQLSGQIVILCTLMAEKKPTGLGSTATTDELKESALRCLYSLFSVLSSSSQSRQALIAESNVPQLGQTISILLDGMEDGGSSEVQVASTNALQAFIHRVATPDIIANFMPGITSRLTKVLTIQTRQRRAPAVLIGSLDIMTSLLSSTMAETRISSTKGTATVDKTHNSRPSVVDSQWLETAATQLKTALSTIMRLKNHSREDVKQSLARLCLLLVRECRTHLAECAPFAMDTLIALSSGPSGDATKARIADLTRVDNAFPTLLQNSVYGRLQSLPTTMQSSDTLIKVQRLQQLTTAYEILTTSGTDIAMIDRTLAKTLCESVVISFLPAKSTEPELALTSQIRYVDIEAVDAPPGRMEFSNALVQHRGQEEIINEIAQLVKATCRSTTFTAILGDLARSLHQSQGDMLIATFWVLLSATQEAIETVDAIDQFIGVENPMTLFSRDILEDLYSFALRTLTTSFEEPIDARLRSLSLRALALQARVAKTDFRYELIDTLYPVLYSLATPEEALQHDSIVTLNMFTSACGYESVQELIVENVDYLTNAVALKLNAFDISPQAPQVLLMMVRLAGPALLPYLEDTVESIFAALEDYHGYPLLVELLFRVLSVIAEEGTKASQLAATGTPRSKLLQSDDLGAHSMMVSQLVEILQEQNKEDPRLHEQDPDVQQSHPQRPWSGTEKANIDQSGSDANSEERESLGEDDQGVDDSEAPPPVPKTYGILLKITELTQHFLPSASPSLRTSLLALIKMCTPAIAHHENSFLPLINLLWPEIVSRLDDGEPQVLATALEVIGELCAYAGDFMHSRILQLWPRVMEIYQNHGSHNVWTRGSSSAPQARSSRIPNSTSLVLGNADLPQGSMRHTVIMAKYSDTSTELIRQSCASVIIAIIRHVEISPTIFDDALHILQPALEERVVCSAFETQNADAVWLARIRSGAIAPPPIPNPYQRQNWKFAAVSR